MEKHTIEPFYDENSEVLILGSFPSIKSREAGFYYHHPQNRFWKVLGILFDEEITDIASKKKFLTKHHISLFDVCASCEIKGSSDASIKNVIPNDIGVIIHNSKVKTIFVDGKTAYNLYNKYIRDNIGIEAICLPSTSPANATFSLERLVEEYRILQKYVKD